MLSEFSKFKSLSQSKLPFSIPEISDGRCYPHHCKFGLWRVLSLQFSGFVGDNSSEGGGTLFWSIQNG
jgi:hypothetical protein